MSAEAAAAVLASATDVEDGYSPPWRPHDEYASKVLFDVISSRSALSGPGNDGSSTWSPSSTLTSGGRSSGGA